MSWNTEWQGDSLRLVCVALLTARSGTRPPGPADAESDMWILDVECGFSCVSWLLFLVAWKLRKRQVVCVPLLLFLFIPCWTLMVTSATHAGSASGWPTSRTLGARRLTGAGAHAPHNGTPRRFISLDKDAARSSIHLNSIPVLCFALTLHITPFPDQPLSTPCPTPNPTRAHQRKPDPALTMPPPGPITLPAISTLPTLPDTALAAALDLLFEPSPALHALALPTLRATPPFPSYPALIAVLRERLLALASSGSSTGSSTSEEQKEVAEEGMGGKKDKETLYDILGSHPRLGERRKEVVLSGFSSAEQRHLQQQDEREREELARLNAEYEARFPGLRYVVWVNGRAMGEVVADMRRRMARGDVEEEEGEVIEVGLYFLFFFRFFLL